MYKDAKEQMEDQALRGLLEKGASADIEKVAQTANEVTRTQIREGSFANKILPPEKIGNERLTKTMTEDLIVIDDLEPDSPGAKYVPFETVPEGEIITGSRYITPMARIVTPKFTKDIDQWQADSIVRFFSNPTVKVAGKPADEVFVKDGAPMTMADTLQAGFFYKQLVAPSDTTTFKNDTTVYINYTGKLLNGLVFDTNIKRVAQDNGLYSPSKTYGPVKITWGEKYSEITMGSENSSVIGGFALTLWQMRAMEKGVGVFWSALGYSYSGSGASIPPYSPLIFEIELVAEPED